MLVNICFPFGIELCYNHLNRFNNDSEAESDEESCVSESTENFGSCESECISLPGLWTEDYGDEGDD